MEWLGALMVAGAGVLAGLLGAGELEKTVRRREELCWFLDRLSGELEGFCRPLPELFGHLGAVCTGKSGELCRRVAECLAAPERDAFETVWHRSLEHCPRRERQILLPLGSVLGRSAVETQLPAIALCRREMERALSEAREKRRDMSRVYIGLGTAGGVMLAVLLI